MHSVNLQEIVKEISDSRWGFYVYLMYKPDGSPFYVGKGTRRKKWERIKAHEKEAMSLLPYASNPYWNWHKVHTIRKIWRDGKQVLYSIDSWHQTADAAYDRELELIAKIGRKWKGEGPLTNITEGGREESDISEETKQKISESLKKYYESNPEAALEMSERNRRFFEDNPEAVERARQNAVTNKSHEHLARWREENPDELAEKQRKHSEVMKRWHEEHREEYKEIAAKRNEHFRSEEHRAKMAEATRVFIQQNPEADKERREKAKKTRQENFDKRDEVRGWCFLKLRDILVRTGNLHIDGNQRSSVSQKQVRRWKQQQKIPVDIKIPDAFAPLESWYEFHLELSSILDTMKSPIQGPIS